MYNFTKWSKSHEQLAKNYLQKNSKLKPLPTKILDWIDYARPIVENKKRDFLTSPFWLPIYNDVHDYQMIIGGRQIYKSTACTDFIAFAATAQPQDTSPFSSRRSADSRCSCRTGAR